MQRVCLCFQQIRVIHMTIPAFPLLHKTLLALTVSLSVSSLADACTRAVYQGRGAGGDRSYHGLAQRYADQSLGAARGIAREGEAGAHSMTWTSRYGSVVMRQASMRAPPTA